MAKHIYKQYSINSRFLNFQHKWNEVYTTTCTLLPSLITSREKRNYCNTGAPISASTNSSRNLIRSYMAKTYVPPPILKPSYRPYDYTSNGTLELAYKHPQLLREMDTEQDDFDSSSKSSLYETNKEAEFKFVDDSREKESVVSALKVYVDSCNNHQRNENSFNETRSVKAWEPYNTNRILSRSVSNNSDDSENMIFYQQVQENQANFHVNKVIYSEESSGNFFDSIDNAQDNIKSICHWEAGEGMAEVDSYDRKKCYWSLNSDLK